jgi:hypothetical protein
MTKPPKRPIEAQDMPWSYIGKDELDKAAELAFNYMRDSDVLWDCVLDQHPSPYHTQGSETQEVFQRVVLSVLGTTVPAMLRERAKDYPETGDNLLDLADELEEHHG